jgi:O-Antigen ligase
MSAYAPASPSSRARSPASPPAGQREGSAAGGARLAAAALPTILTAAVLCASTFVAGGGLNLEATSSVEIVLTLLAGVLAAVAIVLAPLHAHRSGTWAIALLFGLAALTALSVAWSVAPDASWQEASLLLTYSAVFAAAALLSRIAPGRWQGVLGGVLLAAVVVCGYALLSKVFPGHLDPNDPYARLRAPYEYWNATGLAAAMGIVTCLWLGTRRHGHALMGALAYPAMGLMMVTLMLAYSRGALAVALLGAAAWLCLVPRRLRGLAMLSTCGLCAAAVVGFDFASSALSSEGVSLARRISAGDQLGALVLAMLLVLCLAGIAIGFAAARKPISPQTRRRAGTLAFGALGAALLAGVLGLASTHRGLTGTISHGLSSLTNANASVPNTPGRLTAVSSVRARYWKQAFEIFEAHPLLGVGGGGYASARRHYEGGTLVVTHAHGYVVQTLADLGLAGITITLALLAAWMVAAGRATHPFNRRWSRWRWRATAAPYTHERIGLITMLCIVITFGLHSLVDWTLYVPGTACVALICAGWLAGRGPIEQPPSSTGETWRHLSPSRITPLRTATALAAVLAALLAAWIEWQPQRASESSQQALALIAAGKPAAALTPARASVSQDPLSLSSLSTLAAVQQALGEQAKARATHQRGVREQPANPQAWRELGEFDLESGDLAAALSELRAAYYLDPGIVDRNNYVLALRALAAPRLPAATQNRALRGARNGSVSALKTAPASRLRASAPVPKAHLLRRGSSRLGSESHAAGGSSCASCRSAGGRSRDRNELRRLLELARARAHKACRGQAC